MALVRHSGARPQRVGNPSEEEGEALEARPCLARWSDFDLHAGRAPPRPMGTPHPAEWDDDTLRFDSCS